MLTHEKIRLETEQIIKLLATSDRPVTSFFHILKPGLTLMTIPNLLATILLILEWYNGYITSGVGPVAYLGNLVLSFFTGCNAFTVCKLFLHAIYEGGGKT